MSMMWHATNVTFNVGGQGGPSRAQQFSERAFVTETFVGLRAFCVDALGRLVGPQYGGIFTPGENVALCHVEDDPWASASKKLLREMEAMSRTIDSAVLKEPRKRKHANAYAAVGDEMSRRAREENDRKAREERERRLQEAEEERRRNHVVGSTDCSCGFYAYFDGGNDYLSTEMGRRSGPRVGAIVEGYGICTAGSRGFRASKARLVALILPEPSTPQVALTHRLIERNYTGVPIYASDTEAVAKHPLSIGHIPSPQDDDFWTRSAS